MDTGEEDPKGPAGGKHKDSKHWILAGRDLEEDFTELSLYYGTAST